MSPILDVKDQSVSFFQGKEVVPIIDKLSFKLYEGETVALVGESGSGKSVLAKSLLGLLPLRTSHTRSHRVQFLGRDLMKLTLKELRNVRGRHIGFVFQDPLSSLNPTMKIGDQIGESIKKKTPHQGRAQVRWETIELLKDVGITDPEIRYEQYPHELSGGMRQRVMIAISLAPSPELLIMDEPTTALDVTIQAQILKLIREIQKKRSLTILFITHDLSLVAGFCNRVLVMYAGGIVEAAPTEELFTNPQHPYTRALLQAIPRLDLPADRPLKPIQGSPPDFSHPLPGCPFALRCSKALPKCKSDKPPIRQSGDHLTQCHLK